MARRFLAGWSASLQALGGAFAELARGDWRRVWTWGLAALLCGLFWELMNMPARARWIYTVPFFDATLGVENTLR
mgnify:CR=1 FL=1